MTDMERVINALKQCISADMTCEGCPYEGTTCTTTLNTDVLNLLQDVAPVKHAHWIPNGKWVNCSACGVINCKQKYCGECGAKMDEVSE